MKKLIHTSPFLLLLLPMFLMAILMISTNDKRVEYNENAMIKKSSQNKSILQAAVSLFK